MDFPRRSSRLRWPVDFRQPPPQSIPRKRKQKPRPPSPVPPCSPAPEASTTSNSETIPPIDPFTYEHDLRSSSLPPEMFTYAPSCASSDTGTRENTPFPHSFSRESTPCDREPGPAVVKKESTPIALREASPKLEDGEIVVPTSSGNKDSTPTQHAPQETPELKTFEERFLGL
ncbi:uncharacterized protein BT62DRAFT_623775 [Guyanagaster necrorhizus]|uniref:Uncharacterized protein n=1 Tax=Guyanagaster necrorhizus TaxID=856835 RepID=A0A9P7VGM7_9AGAR|nr:uncharacterized protein BT62DRAFT_623775 [Guyanagaster necrorhizus MCA 3950]KAG7440364.1 hypothetical protein BT62DRAFT_623775 [Guyanagaster necrorhizus MCA 3950]